MPVGGSRPTFSVASYNIHRCLGTDRRRDAARIAAVIRDLDCDAVGLQEVDSHAGPHADSMQLEYLARATGMEAISGPTILHHDGDYGNALLTRRPVLAVRRHELSFATHEPRGALDVDLDIDGMALRIIVTHLGLRPAERRHQVKLLLSLLHPVEHSQIVVALGDINEWLPIGRPLRWLHGLLGSPPSQRTFPTWLPIFALDRIWVRPRKSLLDLRAQDGPLARRASDHYPLRAVISLT
ncbi:MAG: endonuclease/exonuclease/phosphatase family protein [Thiobacillaceae bacterium]